MTRLDVSVTRELMDGGCLPENAAGPRPTTLLLRTFLSLNC